MNIEICSAAVDETIDRLVLTTKDGISAIALSTIEAEWVQKKLDEGSSMISVNQFTKTIHIVLVDTKKELWQALEKTRKAAATVLKRVVADKKNSLFVIDQLQESNFTIAALEGIYLANYQFGKYVTKADRLRTKMEKVLLQSAVVTDGQVSELVACCSSTHLARTWVNEPVMSLPSQEYAKQLQALGSIAGLSVVVREKAWIEKEAMGGLLAVNKGSLDEPYFVEFEWKPAGARNEKPYVLVGKGIVFDSGGLNIKPGASMEHMKSDMAGSAAVAGVMRTAALTQLPLHIKAYIPITDNRLGGNAYAPGDVIKMRSGLTVEVLNTDAEGRMILADALDFAKKDEPLLVIDVATLTGSAHAALGEFAAVTMGTADDKTFDALLSKSLITGERLVRFPLWDDYADEIKSSIADLKNVGGPNAGAITAGKFLENFTSYPWIHIDMSGKSFLKSNDDYRGTGGTGYGVRVLYEFFKDIACKE